MEVTIETLDYYGYGITHINNKVIFVKDALPGEVVKIEIVEDEKSYSKAVVLEYITKSNNRIEPICPYFNTCGGCSLMFYNYSKTLEFKKNKIIELLNKNKLEYPKDIEVIANIKNLNYRNKVSLKIVDGALGYYEPKSHKLVEIKECLIANPEINKIIKNYQLIGVKNGSLVIRVNSNNEVLLIIETQESNYNIELAKLKKLVKLVGIVYNNKTIYQDNFFHERLGGFLFKVSYNSFFQINPYICKELFKLIASEINNADVVLDLYSGVGTLSLIASKKAKKVISVEIIKNAVLNGIHNAKINNCPNIDFLLGDVSKIINKITINFDTLIIDPPRSGLDKNTISFIEKKLPSKIIYVSCNAFTLMRDLTKLSSIYDIKDFKILDMFSYSHHIECYSVLNLKKDQKLK